MKKIFLFLLISIFLISLVSAWEYDNTYNYGSATAYAKVIGMYPECDGNTHGSYCAGRWYVDVDFVGDKFYLGEQMENWASESESGYSGIPSISPGRKYLSFNGGEFPRYIICAWDYNQASNGDWAWSGKCGGYLGSGNLDGKKNVECYDNSDCGSSEFCNKDGDWGNWNCEYKICNEAEERCFGANLQKCEGNGWVDKGKILNKCGVACLDDSHCPTDEVSDKFCSGNNIMETKIDNSCFNYQCDSSAQDVILETCSFKCEDIEGDGTICIEKICDEGELMCSDEENALMCQSNQWELKEECDYGCEDGGCKSFYTTNTFYGIIAGSIAVLIIIIILIIIFASKKRKR